ncbi:carbohydrate sulfotransferase 9-like [Scylla paramamosain]|uniref:carbohydrate sulfotransferase 9-like n=1 Tax=Scylla paramamosain TaxID=85552 RepID=UPI003083480A
MRKLTKLRPKLLLALVVLAVLVTLLGPYSYTPRLLDAHTSSPPPAIHVSLDTEGDTEGGSKNETRQVSLAETRAEETVEGMQILQEPLPVSQESYIQNPPPKDWVEVKKTKPKVKPMGRAAGRAKAMSSGQKDAAAALKVLGFLPKDLQNRAQTFPEDSPLRQFLAEQERRVSHVAATCRSFQPSLADIVAGSRGPPAGLLSIKHLIYDRVNQLTFCPVYKAASTSWTITMLQLAGLWNAKTKAIPIQKLVHMFYPKMTGLAAATVTTNTTHFMVVRHPLQRLLSCYLDKFQYASKEYYYHLYGEKIIQRYRDSLIGLSGHQVQIYKEEVRAAMRRAENEENGGDLVSLPGNPFATPLGPTFPEFVDHVAQTSYDDEHWRSYASHCVPCTLSYEFVLRFESLTEENKWFLEYLNRSGEVAPRWDNPNPSGDTTKLSCEYYNQLTLKQIDALIAKYKKDLLLYEYDAKGHRKCAKDYIEENEVRSVIPLVNDDRELNENGVRLDDLNANTKQNENEDVLDVWGVSASNAASETHKASEYIKLLT